MCVTCAVQVGVGGSVPGAKAWGAGITVLGVGGVDTKASYLTVRTIHHLHKLPTPEKDETAMSRHLVCMRDIIMAFKCRGQDECLSNPLSLPD